MMKKIVAIMMICVFAFMLIGCSAHIHQVGKGAQGRDLIEQRQWYVLFGLIPINEVDTADMADGANDYTITTEQNATDILINIFTSMVSVYSRTVTVEK